MTQNCTNCQWRGPARTPQLNKKPEHAATCEYPLPSYTLIDFNITDVSRHINLAVLLPESEFYNSDQAAKWCSTWLEQLT